jgi:hypothetical protein
MAQPVNFGTPYRLVEQESSANGTLGVDDDRSATDEAV